MKTSILLGNVAQKLLIILETGDSVSFVVLTAVHSTKPFIIIIVIIISVSVGVSVGVGVGVGVGVSVTVSVSVSVSV